MRNESATLRASDRAPAFELMAANRFDLLQQPRRYSLEELRSGGRLILEFLRGTW